MEPTSETAKSNLGDPMLVEEMSLQRSGGSIIIGIPAAGVKLLNFSADESRNVEVHPDGVFIPREAPDE